jgi:long-chain acyl-CoA synthetase
MSFEGMFDEPMIDRLQRDCEKHAHKPAIVFLGKVFTYDKLRELIDRFAMALHALGVREGDKVMLYISNCPQFLISFFGSQRIGAVPVPVSPIYTASEITYLINDCGAETIFCQDTNFGYVKEVFPKTCLKTAIVTNLVDLLPYWKRALGILLDKSPRGAVERSRQVHSFRDLIHRYEPKPRVVKVDPRKDLAYLMYTGGTTGFPKGVPGNHATLGAAIADSFEIFRGYVKMDGEEVFLLAIPLFHILALASILGNGLCRGNSTILMPIPQVDAILDAMQRYKVTLFTGVPALYRMILENDRLDQYDLSSLKYCWSGGDVLPLEIFKRWKERFHIPIYQAFGSTEVVGVAQSRLDREPVPGSVGMFVATKEFMVVDPESLKPVPPNKEGELLVTADYLIKNYWNKPEETNNSFVEIDGKTWYRMRDYVRMDLDGLVYYVDRDADVIKYKGYRVSASEIEAVLQGHPTVIGACVVGVPDQKVGERIKAMVVLKEDARGVGSVELTKWCRERLSPYKVPSYIEFRDMLPKSKVGKLLRRELREEERKKAAHN